MTVAFVNHPWDTMDLSALSGSLPIWTYEVASRLPKANSVLIFARRGSKQAAGQSIDNLTLRRIAIDTDPLSHKLLRRIPGLWSARKPFFASRHHYRSFIGQVADTLTTHAADIVHIHNFSQYAPIIRKALPNARICVHMHCEWLSQLDTARVAKNLDHVDAVFACSQYVVDRIARKQPQHASKCHCIYNGVNTETFSPETNHSTKRDSDNLRILFVGRLSPEKGVHVLIKAFNEIAARVPNAVLDIVGPEGSAPIEYIVGLSDDERVKALARFYEGDYMQQLRDGLSDEAAIRVNFIGGLPQADLVARYRDADVLVNPSLSEAFGMSLVEAMACETPVVAARTGGMSEIVLPGETGVLVNPDDPKSLADGICDMLGDAVKRKAMGAAGRSRVLEMFTWDKIAATVSARYDELLAN